MAQLTLPSELFIRMRAIVIFEVPTGIEIGSVDKDVGESVMAKFNLASPAPKCDYTLYVSPEELQVIYVAFEVGAQGDEEWSEEDYSTVMANDPNS